MTESRNRLEAIFSLMYLKIRLITRTSSRKRFSLAPIPWQRQDLRKLDFTMTSLNLQDADVKSFIQRRSRSPATSIKKRKPSQLRIYLSETRMRFINNVLLDTLTRDSLWKILKLSLRRFEGKLFPDSFYPVSHLRIFKNLKSCSVFSVWVFCLINPLS